MKHPLRTIALLLSLWGALPAMPAVSAAELAGSAQSRVRPYSVERAEQWTLRSKAGRTFEIAVARPRAPAPQGGYPILYVLDAKTAFATLADFARNHERMFGPVVVVGIGYPSDVEIANRMFDLSPPTDPATLPAYLASRSGPLGGADEFLSFFETELKPTIEQSVCIDRTRQALFGHSLGGLFVLHVLLTRPEAFDTYIAGSPSIWWGDSAILQRLPAFEARQKQSGADRRLLITVGELESILNAEEEREAQARSVADAQDLKRHANMVNNAAALAQRLAPLSAHGLSSEFVLFAGETHNSVIPAYLSRGARFTLLGWWGPSTRER